MNPNSSRIRSNQSAITSAQIEQLLAMRETQKGLKERLKLMDEAVEKAEETIIAMVCKGADISACGFEVRVQELERRYPAWKEHFISRLGKAEADSVMENTAPVTFKRLVVK